MEMPKYLVYAVPVGNKEALHHHTVDACKTNHNYPHIFEQMQWSMMRHVKAYTGSHSQHFEHLVHK
jgi:hypothetical protein